MSQDLQPVATTHTPAQTATKAVLILAMISLWAIQYTLWVPLVWAWHMTVAIVRFATHSLGYIILLILFPIGWLVLAYLLIRDHPEKIHHDHGYLHPWFGQVLTR